MEKVDVALIAGIAGFLLGGGSVFFAASQSKAAREAQEGAASTLALDKDVLNSMDKKLAEFGEAQKALGKRVDRSGSDPAKLWDAVKVLQAKVDALEQGHLAHLPKDDGAAKPPKDAAGDADFDALEKKVFAGEATADEQAKFWAALREKPEILADLMKEAEKTVADSPRDKEARRRLANLYLAKLMTVPDGMEKGLWSNKMIGVEKQILEIDPNDWDARFSVATNYSFWPEQFNKRPDAIKEFEACLKVQEQSTPDPKFAQTYLQLRNLYLKDGRTDEAKKMLDEGLRRFPDDEELKKARDAMK